MGEGEGAGKGVRLQCASGQGGGLATEVITNAQPCRKFKAVFSC